MARECASEWPEYAERLALAFWPGPLTLVVPRAEISPDTVTAGGSTVGIRWPGHPFMQALIRECGFPLAAPSANPSNEVSPTRADHVRSRLGDRIPLIVDGGPSQVGIESTVVDVTGAVARVLRPGMIHLEALRSVVEAMEGEEGQARGPLRSPGRLARHYSPRARLRVARWANDAELRAELDRLGAEAEATQVIAHTHIPGGEGLGGVSVIPHDAEAFARALYAEWHRIDGTGAGWIVVEDVPEGAGWQGIADRLRRAEGK
jgi:L-threonylcarbamoyladenylate synthase